MDTEHQTLDLTEVLDRLAGHRPRYEDDVGEGGEDCALRALGEGAGADRRRELGVDVVHDLHAGLAGIGAQLQGSGGIRNP